MNLGLLSVTISLNKYSTVKIPTVITSNKDNASLVSVDKSGSVSIENEINDAIINN